MLHTDSETARPARLDPFRLSSALNCPDLAQATFIAQHQGWDVTAYELDSGLIIRIPRHARAWRKLKREQMVLDSIRDYVPFEIPHVSLRSRPLRFSCHMKLRGRHVDPTIYCRLSSSERSTLGRNLAAAFRHLHAIPPDAFNIRLPTNLTRNADIQSALAAMNTRLSRRLAIRVRRAFASVPSVALQRTRLVFSHFDLHGKNLVFNESTTTVTGMFDFLDAGFGDAAKDLSKLVKIHVELAKNVLQEYTREHQVSIPFSEVLAYSLLEQITDIINLGVQSIPARATVIRSVLAAFDAE